ncbi:MAG: hypothetical protein JST65_07640 [Acidobacteria bacterium]|nr:hypothetical protein [Acidobacteriota bacterium]
MRRLACTGAALVVALTACATSGQDEARKSVFSSLAHKDCVAKTLPNDPNDTPYRACPGAAGYTLHVVPADAGRSTIDVVDPSGRSFPLRLPETVTRDMFELDLRAEWRLAGSTPIALILLLRVHGDPADPSRISNSIAAIAKITPAEVCVTDALSDGGGTIQTVHKTADSARGRPCGPVLP